MTCDDLKKAIKNRILTKYALMILLIFSAVTMLISVTMQIVVPSILGYGGIIVSMVLMCLFPLNSPLKKKGVTKTDYPAILKCLSESGKKSYWVFTEVIFALRPSINYLLYLNDEKEEYYRKNIAFLQSLLIEKSDIYKKITFHQISFSEICKKLYDNYINESDDIDYSTNEIEQDSNERIKENLITNISFKLTFFAKGLPYIIIVIYFIFKMFYTWNFKKFNLINESIVLRVIYNTGADFLAAISAIYAIITRRAK